LAKEPLNIESSTPSTNALLLGIWTHLSRRRRNQLGCLLMVMLASGAAELVSLGAVLPFLAVLSDPEQLWHNPVVQMLASRLGLTSAKQLLLPATLAFVTSAVLVALIRLTNLWLNSRMTALLGTDLSCEAYRRTLYQPYEVHVQSNSASVITGNITQINLTVIALNSLLQVITSAVVASFLLIGLLFINAPIAVAGASLFGSAYGVLAITTRRELRRNGTKIAEASSQQLKALQEGLGAIRDVLLDGSQPTYLRIYQQADRPQRLLQAKNVFLGGFPRYALEALGMVAIAMLGALLVLERGSGADVIPLLGVLALGAQRLLPALQQIYSAWATLKGCNAAMQAVLAMLKQPMPTLGGKSVALSIREGIRLEGVRFRYVPEQPEVLRGLDLEIRLGERIGLIGSTGSGKSTTVDLLMGLLTPTAGRLLVDGADLHDPMYPGRLAAWRGVIAHVPQSIYLADSSIAENIAFGIPKHLIDIERVKKAAEQAQISNFIESRPEGYESFVGERGIRLSGGQRQRIGIARALYKQAKIIIFDEATSALDTSTEKAVIAEVESLSRELTLVMIAHRLSTVAGCDRVILLDNGAVVSSGPPDQILKDNS
jgi:ABC-type bacteriocin/lantibiotic exporter with double-glycine peptidase domain